MPELKLLFFINGSETSAAAIRARSFARRLPSNWDIRFNFRPVPKWKGIGLFIQSAIAFKPDIIYVMDTAYTGVLAGCIAKQLTGCQLITDTGDVAYELAKSMGNYLRSQLKLIQWVEQLAIAHSDRVIVRGSYHKIWLEKQGIDKAVFIPDGVNFEAIQPVEANSLRTELGLGNNLVVGLVGTMAWSQRHQLCYGWDVVEALGLLEDLPIKALLIGDGEGRPILEKRTRELGIGDRVLFTGQIPYDELPCYLSAIDVCVSTQSNDLVGMVRTTGKLPLYLAYGKYIIATDVGEASRVLPNVGCLLPYCGVRDDRHPVRLAEQLRKILSDRLIINVFERARWIAKNHFDYAILTPQVEAVCRNLAS